MAQLNREQLQFCFDELLGELGWGDEIKERVCQMRTRKYQYPANFVLSHATKRGAGNGVLKEACICCGADIPVSWEDEMTREFALVVDVCPKCYQADCSGMSLALDDNERWCNVYNRQSRPTTLAVDTPSAPPKADREPMANPPQETVSPESACH